jgi:hypothetical protein
MERFADSFMDFEYRRLLIEENELDLHVFFSREYVFYWLSWGFLVLALFYWMHPFITSILSGMALVSRSISVFYKRKFQLTFWRYNFSLSLVDAVIYNDYGIRLI